jgi:drug/metabolite transporter (DMT)-like permease
LIVCQQVLFAGETALLHGFGGGLSVCWISELRGIGMLVLAGVLAGGIRSSLYRTEQPLLQIVRGLVSAAYLVVFAYSFSVLPLADATAISYTQTLYTTLFAALILGEKVTGGRWSIALLGFAGAVCVAHPSGSAGSALYLLVIAGTSLNGLSLVLTRLLRRTDEAPTVMFHAAAIAMICFAPGAASAPAHPSWLWVGLLVLGPAGFHAGVLAVRKARISELAPWLYIRLALSSLIGMSVFNEIPDAWTVVGLTLVLLSCLLTYRTDRMENLSRLASQRMS